MISAVQVAAMRVMILFSRLYTTTTVLPKITWKKLQKIIILIPKIETVQLYFLFSKSSQQFLLYLSIASANTYYFHARLRIVYFKIPSSYPNLLLQVFRKYLKNSIEAFCVQTFPDSHFYSYSILNFVEHISKEFYFWCVCQKNHT